LAALGDHTWTHTDLLALPDSAVREELASTRTAIQKETGLLVQLFRPPYGATSTRVGDDAARLRMLQVLWSIDSRDSEGASWSARAASSAKLIIDGPIGRSASRPLVSRSQIRPCATRDGDAASAEARPGWRAEATVRAPTSSTSSKGGRLADLVKRRNARRILARPTIGI